MTEVVAYRHAAYDTPWWAAPSTRPGRFHRPGARYATQYLALHPLGPAAELLRHQLPGPGPDADTVVMNLWAAVVDDAGTVTIDFADCAAFGITPEELVGDDYEPCQALAVRLLADGHRGAAVPSAALPGTFNLVLFGPRVADPYLQRPVGAFECPTGHLTDGARAPAEVTPFVRWRGDAHRALREWRAAGSYAPFDDPAGTRF